MSPGWVITSQHRIFFTIMYRSVMRDEEEAVTSNPCDDLIGVETLESYLKTFDLFKQSLPGNFK